VIVVHKVLALSDHKVIQRILGGFLGLLSLGLIVWVVVVLFSTCPGRYAVCPELPEDFVPPLVALGFWVIGLAVWATQQDFPIVAFFFVTPAILSAGLVSAFQDDQAGRIFYLCLAWQSPLTYHFHRIWAKVPSNPAEKVILKIFYTLAGIWSLPYLLFPMEALRTLGWFSGLRLGVRLTLAVALVATVFLLMDRYRRSPQSVVRSNIRVILFGVVFALTPLILLSLVPNVLGVSFIPFEFNFPWLLILPLFYGYTIFRSRMVKFEGVMIRAIVFYLMAIITISGNLAAAGALSSWLPGWENTWAWISGLIGVFLLFVVIQLRHGLGLFITWVIYGKERVSIEDIDRIASSLALIADRRNLQMQLGEILHSIYPNSGYTLLLRGRQGELLVQDTGGIEIQSKPIEQVRIPVNSPLLTQLIHAGDQILTQDIRRELGQANFLSGEGVLLSTPRDTLWIPLISGDQVHGLLLLLPGTEGVYTAEDRRVLSILAHQVGVAVHNIILVEDIRLGREELAQAHKQALLEREKQQRHLAQDLHDGVVQQLLGISYNLTGIQKALYTNSPINETKSHPVLLKIEETRSEILRLVDQIRILVSELRPSGLDEMGLPAALESYVTKVRREIGPGSPKIILEVDQGLPGLQETLAICLFRIAQEALRNALNHAQADNVFVSVRMKDGCCTLQVWDDGCGFHLPSRVSEFAQDNHFGLVGISERASWVSGQLTIRTLPGEGTEIKVEIPMNQVGEV
jgi:signal transduction histidine kinase